jgi:hypothetical protein
MNFLPEPYNHLTKLPEFSNGLLFVSKRIGKQQVYACLALKSLFNGI